MIPAQSILIHADGGAASAPDGSVEYFRFEGDFSAVAIDWLTSEVRRKMEAVPVAPRARTRLFASFVEMTQNILHYAEPESPGRRRAGAISLGRDAGGYFVASRNPVRGVHAERLRTRLGRIQSMGPDEITAAYRQGLSAERVRDPLSRGAGLGLLSIARTTNGAVSYRLDPLRPGGGEPYTFSLKATVRAEAA
jgi:hypothetical protein